MFARNSTTRTRSSDQLLNIDHTSMFSNRTLNEITIGYLRQDGHAEDPTPESPTITAVGNGVAGFGVEFWHPIEFTQNNLQFKDTLTLERGRHSFRTGGELRSGHDGATLHHWERPNYTFQNILDFIDDEAFTETRAVDPATGQSTTAYGKYITNEWALFFQDNWKVRPNLTLNLGLRYDNFGNPGKDRDPVQRNHPRGRARHRQEQIANGAASARSTSCIDTDWNNFAPAFRHYLGSHVGRTLVFRGGGGISYNRINNTVFSDERLNPPQFAQASRLGAGASIADRLLARAQLSRPTPRSAAVSTPTAASAAPASPCAWSIRELRDPRCPTTGSPACSVSCRGASSPKRTTAAPRGGNC